MTPSFAATATRTKARKPEPGIHLTLSISERSVTVLHAASIRHSPREYLRPPALTPQILPTLSHPTSELVLTVVGECGTVLDEFGWPWKEPEFGDVITRESGFLSYPPRYVATPIRLWRIPLRKGAKLIVINRVDARGGGPGQATAGSGVRFALIKRTLAVYHLGSAPSSREAAALGAAIQPVPLPHVVDLWCPKASKPLGAIEFAGSGGIIPAQNQPQVGQNQFEHRYNIAVIGDGFTKAELCKYDQRVSKLVNGLKGIAPFSGLWGSLNFWSIRAWSKDSGISCAGCGNNAVCTPKVKQTYLGLQGCFGGTPNPGYVGTPYPCRLYQAVSTLVPLQHLDLVIAIANTDESGGRGLNRVVFCTMSNEPDWSHLVAHECGHAIANLAEERIVADHHDPVDRHDNQATLQQVGSGMLPWRASLPQGPTVVHQYGEALTAGGQPDISTPQYNSLGAFWGCLNTVTGEVPHSGPQCRNQSPSWRQYFDCRGRDYFRPAAECRMRRLDWEFCGVCMAELDARIQARLV